MSPPKTPQNIANQLQEIEGLIHDLKSTIESKSKSTIEDIWSKNLDEAKEFLTWIIHKYKLRRHSASKNIFQRDIFYANLGFNIGDETSNERPVVILQNNAGNRTSSVTIVAPITTFDGSTLTQDQTGKYFIEWVEDGVMKSRPLYYFEIPVQVEPNPNQNVTGVINVSQIRTISKKRLRGEFLAKITMSSKQNVDAVLPRLFR